jgi:hypothetical protein
MQARAITTGERMDAKELLDQIEAYKENTPCAICAGGVCRDGGEAG